MGHRYRKDWIDLVLHGQNAHIVRDQGDPDEVEDEGAVSLGLAAVAPACHHRLLADLGELALRQATVWEADGHNGLRESGGPGQVEQRDVIVTGALGVVGVDEHLLDVQVHFPLLPAPQVILPCRAEGLSEWAWESLPPLGPPEANVAATLLQALVEGQQEWSPRMPGTVLGHMVPIKGNSP